MSDVTRILRALSALAEEHGPDAVIAAARKMTEQHEAAARECAELNGETAEGARADALIRAHDKQVHKVAFLEAALFLMGRADEQQRCIARATIKGDHGGAFTHAKCAEALREAAADLERKA